MRRPIRLPRRPRLFAWGTLVFTFGVLPALGQSGEFPSMGSDLGQMRPVSRQPLFFPPNPPPHSRPIGRGAAAGDSRPPAPAELAHHVNEFFYPALGSRLHAKTLKEPLRKQLDAYRAAKLALQNELRTELERLRPAEPAARLQALTTLARKQSPSLAQLEKDAEQLRRDLIVSDLTWGALREWRLGDRDRRGFSPIEIAQVMRSYAFYQSGLLPAQRRLLREISLELMMAAENQDKATAAQPHIFFPPEPARVMFPEDMPPAAAAKLAAFQTKKTLLKKELYDSVYKHDGETFSFLKGNTISGLVNKQSARLTELETLAEEIRRLLPADASVAAPERSPLPVALNNRISAMMAAYTVAQTGASSKIDAIISRAKGLPFQSSYRFDAEGLRFLVVPTRYAARQPEALKKIERVRADVSAVAEEYGRTLAELMNERTAIRVEISQALATNKDAEIDAALYAAMRVVHQKQTEGVYDEYRVAVFEPGLSPEQRRLLFDAVVEKLELPLPRGELQPTRRGNSW